MSSPSLPQKAIKWLLILVTLIMCLIHTEIYKGICPACSNVGNDVKQAVQLSMIMSILFLFTLVVIPTQNYSSIWTASIIFIFMTIIMGANAHIYRKMSGNSCNKQLLKYVGANLGISTSVVSLSLITLIITGLKEKKSGNLTISAIQEKYMPPKK